MNKRTNICLWSAMCWVLFVIHLWNFHSNYDCVSSDLCTNLMVKPFDLNTIIRLEILVFYVCWLSFLKTHVMIWKAVYFGKSKIRLLGAGWEDLNWIPWDDELDVDIYNLSMCVSYPISGVNILQSKLKAWAETLFHYFTFLSSPKSHSHLEET